MCFFRSFGSFVLVCSVFSVIGCGAYQSSDKAAINSITTTNNVTVVPPSNDNTDFPKILDERALANAVNPCENFYQFSCGQWLDTTVIPADKNSVNRQATALSDATDVNLNKIIVSYVNNNNSNPTVNAGKIAAFYNSCINATQNSEASLAILKNQIKQIKSIKNKKDIATISAVLAAEGLAPFFYFGATPSMQNSEQNIADISQGGYNLGEKSYYFDTDAKSLEIVKKYKAYIAQIFEMLGHSKAQAKAIANSVYAFEKQLASQAYSVADQSDSTKINHPIGLEGLKKVSPNFAWETYFATLKTPELQSMNVAEPEFFQNLSTLINTASNRVVIHYLTWLATNHAATFMGGNFEQAHFDFWSKYLSGAQTMQPQWKKCTQRVENYLGYALAEAYVKTFDGAAIKQKTEEMITEIKSAFSENIKTLDWLDDATLGKAEEKISLMTQKVGAPEIWRDYTALEMTNNNYFLNIVNIDRFETRRDLAKIGNSVDKSEWGMMPWEVNAYYEPSLNEFNFPFGILQPPSMDLSASVGANMGAFGGGTIGHELTHGFDTDGSQFDSHGNLNSWWSQATLDKFNEKAQCFIAQASTYKIDAVGLNVNGEQTITENLADQGGVKLGYIALIKSMQNRAEAPLWLNRFNERQQYWIAYGQSWCTKQSPESLRQQMTSDTHPPAEFRVNSVIMNRPEFARDFNCPAQSKMAPVTRCSIW